MEPDGRPPPDAFKPEGDPMPSSTPSSTRPRVEQPDADRSPDDRLVDLREGGTRTGYAGETLRKYIGTDNGPPFHKYGGKWLAWLSDLDAWIDDRRTTGDGS